MLTLENLMTKSLGNAELAVLSACQTATGDGRLPNKSVHLTAGMLAVGCYGVIGTMWPIQDQGAPIVAEALDSNLLRSGRDRERKLNVAYALHEAVNSLRELKVGVSRFSRWVPFVHFDK